MADIDTQKKKVLGVIPARLGSSRIPEKMLADICGKKLIEWTVLRTKQCNSLDALVVTTDSELIADIVKKLDVPVIMTPSELPTGTDRVAAAIEQFKDFTPDIVANIWGDEPLYPAEAIDGCVEALLADDELQVAVAADHLTDSALIDEPSIVKVVTDMQNNALYFSRAHIPFQYTANNEYEHYHVIGVMAMKKNFLDKFLTFKMTPIEKVEGVEQMRVLENGYRMKVVKGDFHNLGVNTPDELEKVRAIMQARVNG